MRLCILHLQFEIPYIFFRKAKDYAVIDGRPHAEMNKLKIKYFEMINLIILLV